MAKLSYTIVWLKKDLSNCLRFYGIAMNLNITKRNSFSF